MSLRNYVLGVLPLLVAAASCAKGEDNPPDGGGQPTDGSVLTDGPRGDGGCTKDNCSDGPTGPHLNPAWPPYGLTWTSTGDLGRAGGLTWGYTGIQRTGIVHIWWVICDDPTMPCGVSLSGPITTSTQWAFDGTDSNLPSGKIVFTNTNAILLADGTTRPLSGRLTVNMVDYANSPVPFATVASLGLNVRSGQYGAEIKGTGFTVTALVEVEDTITNTWTPYLDYYDQQHTPEDAGTLDAGGNAYISFGGSFYND